MIFEGMNVGRQITRLARGHVNIVVYGESPHDSEKTFHWHIEMEGNPQPRMYQTLSKMLQPFNCGRKAGHLSIRAMLTAANGRRWPYPLPCSLYLVAWVRHRARREA